MFLQGPRTSVTQERATRTTDNRGGFTNVWNTVETFDAILNPLSPDENIKYGKDTVTSMYKMYIEINGRTITEQDRFTFDSKTLLILGVENPFQKGLFYKIILEETQ